MPRRPVEAPETAAPATDSRPRDVLAQNLVTLMAASRFRTLPDIVKASGGQISNGTLDRIRRKDAATGVDSLKPLADVFGMEAWQLLVPGLMAEEGGDGLPVVTGLPDWPLPMVDSRRFYSLSQTERAYVQAKMAAAIDEFEPDAPPPNGGEDQLAQNAVLKPVHSTVAKVRRPTGTR